MAVTIYQVARAAEVSVSTVSRAFSRPGRVTAKYVGKVTKVRLPSGWTCTVGLAKASTRAWGSGLRHVMNAPCVRPR